MELNDENKDRLDRWLDGALRQCGNAKPRMGLERRILANLELAAQDRRRSRGWWWAWGIPTLIACVAMVVCIGIDQYHAAKKTVASENSAANAGLFSSQPKHAPVQLQVTTKAAHRGRRSAPRLSIAAAKEPRLKQFPSERPLSEQEQMLSRYVKEFPEQAVFVAQAQAESQKELDRLIAEESSN